MNLNLEVEKRIKKLSAGDRKTVDYNGKTLVGMKDSRGFWTIYIRSYYGNLQQTDGLFKSFEEGIAKIKKEIDQKKY